MSAPKHRPARAPVADNLAGPSKPTHAPPQRPRPRRRWLVGVALAALALVGGAAFLFTELDLSAFYHTAIARITALPAPLIIALFALLPVGGFSVSVVYLVAGLRFGPLWGGVVVAGVTVFHLCATHLLARSFLSAPLRRFIRRKNYRWPEIAESERAAVAVMAALVPGLPYVVRNALLALSGLPLRLYLPICAPIYVARSYVTILLGDVGGDLTGRRALILGAVLAVKLTICALILRRMQKRHGIRFVPAT